MEEPFGLIQRETLQSGLILRWVTWACFRCENEMVCVGKHLWEWLVHVFDMLGWYPQHSYQWDGQHCSRTARGLLEDCWCWDCLGTAGDCLGTAAAMTRLEESIVAHIFGVKMFARVPRTQPRPVRGRTRRSRRSARLQAAKSGLPGAAGAFQRPPRPRRASVFGK